MNEAQKAIASDLWKRGMAQQEICRKTGLHRDLLRRTALVEPELFPKRIAPGGRIRFVRGADYAIVKAMELPADRMKWKLENGVCITLPRVSSISCPR